MEGSNDSLIFKIKPNCFSILGRQNAYGTESVVWLSIGILEFLRFLFYNGHFTILIFSKGNGHLYIFYIDLHDGNYKSLGHEIEYDRGCWHLDGIISITVSPINIQTLHGMNQRKPLCKQGENRGMKSWVGLRRIRSKKAKESCAFSLDNLEHSKK